jgi:ribulose-phosphate 3-epimerase
MFLDVHLMMYNPFDYIERFIEAGADRLTFHFEATEDVEETLEYIRRCNIKAGLAFSPDTSLSMIPKYLNKCDRILIMTVNPGFGGQSLIPTVLQKIRVIHDLYPSLPICVDGGVKYCEGAIGGRFGGAKAGIDRRARFERLAVLKVGRLVQLAD